MPGMAGRNALESELYRLRQENSDLRKENEELKSGSSQRIDGGSPEKSDREPPARGRFRKEIVTPED